MATKIKATFKAEKGDCDITVIWNFEFDNGVTSEGEIFSPEGVKIIKEGETKKVEITFPTDIAIEVKQMYTGKKKGGGTTVGAGQVIEIIK